MLADNALTTLDSAIEFLGIEREFDEDENDVTNTTNIVIAINVASAIIESYCRRKFRKQIHTEYFDRNREITLLEYPVQELISADGNPVHRSFYIDQDSGIVIMRSGRIGGIIEYEAGYVLPKDATDDEPRTLPHDIEYACNRLINEVFVDEDGYVMDINTLKLGDWSTGGGNRSISDVQSVIPADVTLMLELHRKVLL